MARAATAPTAVVALVLLGAAALPRTADAQRVQPASARPSRFPLAPRPAWAPPEEPVVPPDAPPEPAAPLPAWGITAEPPREQRLPVVYITPRDPPAPRIEVESPQSRTEDAAAALAPPAHPPRNRLGRVVIESIGGAVLGGGAAALGAMIGSALGGACLIGMTGTCTGAIVGGGIGAVVGATLGVTATGYLFDGNGWVGVTALGSFLGAGAGLGTLLLLQPNAGSAALAFVLTLAGAVIAYEISSADSRADAEREQRARAGTHALGPRRPPRAARLRRGALAF